MNVKDRGGSTETGPALDAEGPLRRWARRKRDVAREEQAAAEARRRGVPDARRSGGTSGAHEPDEPDGETPEAAVVEERVLTDEDMPPLESLDEASDYSGFLSPGVSEGLRRRALRKLFTSAVFNVPDGLDDYDDDFTSFQALGDIVTSDMKHRAEMEMERAKQAQARPDAAAASEAEPGGAGDGRPVQEDGEAADAADGEAVSPAREEAAESAESSGLPAVPERGSPAPEEDGSASGDAEAPAGADAANLAGGEAAGEGDSSRALACAEPASPDAVTHGGASSGAGIFAHGGEAAHRERGAPAPEGDDRASGDAEAPAGADAANLAGGEAPGEGESSRSPAPAESEPADSITNGRPSPDADALVSGAETAPRADGSPALVGDGCASPGGEAVRRRT